MTKFILIFCLAVGGLLPFIQDYASKWYFDRKFKRRK